jgi:hypothetical protein
LAELALNRTGESGKRKIYAAGIEMSASNLFPQAGKNRASSFDNSAWAFS